MGAGKITRKASMSLAGKKIVITGAAGGLGAGVAKVAFDQGALSGDGHAHGQLEHTQERH